MARTSDGTYTRVSNSFTNPVTGTPISSTHAEAFFDEMDTEMTDSLSRSGKGGMSADLDMGGNDVVDVGTVVLNGATSGTTTLQATSIAGTTVVTIPAATDTLVGKATTDTLTNKTLTSPTINTPTLTVLDSALTIQDNSDNTKQLQFQASGITTGTTRTLTVPDANTTIVGTDTTQTLTNKTINGSNNTITNVSLTTGVTGDLPFANMVQIDTSRILGRVSASVGDIEALTGANATSLLNNFVGDSGSGGTKGLVPAPASGDAAASKFLKADGTWTAPSGAGDVTGPASATDNAITRFDGTTGKTLQNSGVAIDDSNNVTGVVALTASGAISGGSAAGNMVATQANQETATSTSTLVSPGRQHFHPSAAKAWAVWNSSGTISASYNVTSVTDNGVGNFTVNFTNAMSSANYVAIAGAGYTSGWMASPQVRNFATTSVDVVFRKYDDTQFMDPASAHVVVYGDL